MTVITRDKFMFACSALTLLVSCVGCKYDGSMLQMNSDSPSPFLGLQWSVRNDARTSDQPDVPVRLVRADYARADEIVSDVNTPVELSAPLIPESIRKESHRPARLVPTSDSQRTTGRVRYSLDRSSDSTANLADEMSIRLRQF